MPDKRTIEKAREDKRAGKSVTTQAGEFVREQIEKIRRSAAPRSAAARKAARTKGAAARSTAARKAARTRARRRK
jgi:hypothetical protein